MTDGPIVLFDGVCNLCSAAVRFLIARDPSGRLRFASLQSEAGARVLAAHGRKAPVGEPDTVLLVEGGRVYERSTAALRTAAHLVAPWPLAAVFFAVPRPLRDAIYRLVARRRYRWFGRTEACWVPTTALRARFLDD